jgi:hypothetical protein
MAAFRAGKDSVEHHREVLKLAPDFRDAELTIGLMNYVIGSLPLPTKMLVATMGVRGSKKRGLETLERVAAEGKWARDVEALYFLGATEGLEASWAGGVERKFMAAFRAGKDSVDHHRDVIKLAPDFRDAELTIGLMNYIIGSLPLPTKMLAATMGVRGSKKRGLETLQRVAAEGKWARDVARVLLVDLYKREKRWEDAARVARELAVKYPRNYLFKLQVADALTSQIVTLRKSKKSTVAEEKELQDIFASLLRDKSFDANTRELVNVRWNIARQQLQ